MDTEIKTLIEEQGKAWEEFKATNDEALKAKADGKAVSELDQKMGRINEELDKISSLVDEIARKQSRPEAPAKSAEDWNKKHTEAWLAWLRKGDDRMLERLRKDDPAPSDSGSGDAPAAGGGDDSGSGSGSDATPSARYMNVGTPAEGGYAVPIQQDRQIMRLLETFSPMRQVCRVVSVSTEDYRKLVNLGGTDCGWVGETDARPATNTPQFTTLSPTFGELYAYPEVTQKSLDDLFFDVAGEITRDIAEAFAKAEGTAFMSGTGSTYHQPVGLLTATTTAEADGTRDFGKFQHVITGQAATWASSSPADSFLDLIYKTKPGHRQNGKFMLNSVSLSDVRKWKDGESRYLWQPSMQAGQPSSIFGYPLIVNEYMPSCGANAYPVIFGDFKAAYWIFDRIGIRSLRDPYTHKPFVGFYTTKRLGSMIVNTEALKFLKCAAS